jgi:hypothetical protein
MIKMKESYTIVCDNCKKESTSELDIMGWSDKDYALESALCSGYIEHDDKHYCHDCYHFDDEDNIVIN